jgi:hypothetical protein
MASIISAGTTSGTALNMAGDTSGVLQLATNGSTTAITVDTSQNVGIGTASPTYKLHVANSGFPALGVFRDLDVGSVGTAGQGIEFGARSGSTFTPGATITGFLDNPATTGGLQFLTRSSNTLTERMRIDSSGNVGIGTTSPTAKLDIRGNQYIQANSNPTNSLVIAMTNQTITSNNGCRIGFDAYNIGGASIGIPSDSASLAFYVNGNTTERMRISSNGEVQIAGTTDRGAFNLQCNGTGVWGAGAYTNGSDERIKENITPLDTGLDVVAKLNPVTYTYKEDWSRDQSIQTGFIAQDLLVALEGKNYVDGIVNQSSEYMSVAYQNIIPILTKAIQEQQTIINDLKARIETLEAK